MQRMRKTNSIVRQNITDALFELMAEKPLDEIRISELTRRAQVARVSFYRNFGSKDDVLRAHAKGITERFLERYDVETRLANPCGFLADYLHYYYENRRVVDLFMKSGRMDVLREEFNRAFGVGCPDRRESARRSFLAGGLYNLSYRWTLTGYDVSPEDLANFVYELIFRDCNCKSASE